MGLNTKKILIILLTMIIILIITINTAGYVTWSELTNADLTPTQSIPSIPSTNTPTSSLTAQPTSNLKSLETDTLRIGAFNIQVFGTSKASKPEVMDNIADIIRTYDIVAIQEIRDKSQTALPALVDEVNGDGSAFDYVVSERLGRTSSMEQYAYLYDTGTVELAGTAETYPEPEGTDPFHREPYIASFRALSGDFDATFIVIHTDPDEATEEINALSDVLAYVRGANPDEPDIVVMGDLNADGSYFDEDGPCTLRCSDYFWCIDNGMDTTTSSTDCTYDRIIITDSMEQYFSGDAGVYRFDTEYGLSEDETKAVSDHYPVYMVFSVGEDVRAGN